MVNTFKRAVSLLMILLLMLVSLSVSITAAETEPAITLDQAIQIVKKNFSIPAAYTEFTSRYRSSNDTQAWFLTWNAAEDEKGTFTAKVDAASGIILSMNNYQDESSQSYLPALSIDEAAALGEDLIEQLLPDRADALQLVANHQVIPLARWNGGNYELRWQRMAGNIPVKNEGINLQVNYSNGEIVSYNLNWSDNNLPSGQGVISQQDANRAFAANQMLELQYLLPDSHEEQIKPQLIYCLHHPSNGLIDAATGKPLEVTNRDDYEYSKADTLKIGSADEAGISLTPQEAEEVLQNLNLISQEKAVAIAKQWIQIPGNLILNNVSLRKSYDNSDQRIWTLSWQPAPSSAEDEWTYVSARVNAVTGELINFYVNNDEQNDETPTLTQASAQEIADAFLAGIQPQKAKQLRMQPGYTGDKIPDRWEFNYTRLIDGIPCPQNGINISVDSSSKQITSFNLSWTDTTFPAADHVLGLEKAYTSFLNEQPLTLYYAKINSTVKDATAMKLVYGPLTSDYQFQSYLIDAISGKKLNWDGTPLKQNDTPCVFNDIAGHFAEEEISLLGQAGIMCEYGTSFHPEEEVRLITVVRAMVTARNGNGTNLSDDEIIKTAVRNKWLREASSADSLVNRALLAQLMIRYLGIEYVAQMPVEALTAPYRDIDSLSPDIRGYAALGWGLGVLKKDADFNAAGTITRGEAAYSLVHTLKTAALR